MPPKKHKSSHYHKSDKKNIFDDFDREIVICKCVKPMKNRYTGGKPPKTIYRSSYRKDPHMEYTLPS
ncbi:hypothetical protein BHL37_00140 [Bacillus cereus]|nr:hypothetical protein BHL37_00140 [Bacillus cereus]PJZ19869.1 hypothetical protein CEW46_20990 [Bacillus cereus]